MMVENVPMKGFLNNSKPVPARAHAVALNGSNLCLVAGEVKKTQCRQMESFSVFEPDYADWAVLVMQSNEMITDLHKVQGGEHSKRRIRYSFTPDATVELKAGVIDWTLHAGGQKAVKVA